MTLTEALELLKGSTGLTFTRSKFNGQLEVEVDTWRISISDLSRDLDADVKTTKILCIRLLSNTTGWATGQRWAVYSVREGLLLLSDWINGFLQTWEARK